MAQANIKLSAEFKSQTIRAIFSIILFMLTYLLMVLFALSLTAICIYAGVKLIVFFPKFITIVLGAGIASLGILVLVFLLKFIFKSHKVDSSHLVEVTREQEPVLFGLIEEIVAEVKTSFPRKIYLSAEVNAAVFYNSSFWSMFLPVRKNLLIGIGLVNALTLDELRGVLAHEFGHFSQKTMKVGSFVYNVNQVIFNMLFDNESYDDLLQSWASASGIFVPFVKGAVKIIAGIQWVLKKMYGVVNLSYMSLSRQMEFHADEVAANAVGSSPLKSALLRMELAEHSYQAVLNYYGARIGDRVVSENVYPEQAFVLRFVAAESKIPLINGLPYVSPEELNKFNRSKLVIKDQWASHPSTEERIERLEKLNIVKTHSEGIQASSVLANPESTQKQLTERLFAQVQYDGPVSTLSNIDFRKAFEEEYSLSRFHEVYNGYYDHKNPMKFDVDAEEKKPSVARSLESLFAAENVEAVYQSISLANDIETITSIGTGSAKIKSFDYDGIKYRSSQAFQLVGELKKKLEAVNEKIKETDLFIFHHFRSKESGEGRLAGYYRELFAFEAVGEKGHELYVRFMNATEFIHQTTPFDEITSNLRNVALIEKEMRECIREMLSDDLYAGEISTTIRQNFEKYLSADLEYFAHNSYIDSNLAVLFSAANDFYFLLSRGYLLLKKRLLSYQASLAV